MYTCLIGQKKATNETGRQVLARIRKIRPFIVGSFTVSKKRCGNPRCRCAQEGPIHETALLTWKENGRTRTLNVPADLREEVAGWIEEGKLLKSLMKDMSNAQKEFFASMRKSKKP